MTLTVAETKAGAAAIKQRLPAYMLTGGRFHQMPVKTTRRKRPDHDTADRIDASYDQLTGEWADWKDTARAYDRSVPKQDQFDVRHNILLELAHARARDGEPIPKLRQYRIASLCRINYWRERAKGQAKVCILSGVAKVPYCKDCDQKPKRGRCQWLAVRPMLSLDLEVEDADGQRVSLADTLADDTALDIEAWQDPTFWLIGSPARLIQIADKIKHDKTLSGADRKYLFKWRKREQKRLL